MSTFISDAIKHIGVEDALLEIFENQYPLSHGMAYNSYVIIDEKIAVTDTVDAAYGDMWLEKLEKELDGRTPDYLVVHHMEPDHSSNIAGIMEKYPEMQLVASAKAISMLPMYFEDATFLNRAKVVKEGDSLELGKHCLKFFNAPMVHWPEVLVSFETSERVLFSADAFGRFGALSHGDEWSGEARRYYVNIVGKYGTQVQAALKKLGTLDIRVIAPLHGPVLSGDLTPYMSLYDKWSTYTPEIPDGVMVAYASIYGGTARAALKIAEMLREAGAPEVSTVDLCRCDVSEAVSQAFRMGKFVLASPTYDAGIFPAMHDFLYHLQIKSLRNRRVALIENGSWAPVAANAMKCLIAKLQGFDVVEPHVTIRGRMHKEDVAVMQAVVTALLEK